MAASSSGNQRGPVANEDEVQYPLPLCRFKKPRDNCKITPYAPSPLRNIESSTDIDDSTNTTRPPPGREPATTATHPSPSYIVKTVRWAIQPSSLHPTSSGLRNHMASRAKDDDDGPPLPSLLHKVPAYTDLNVPLREALRRDVESAAALGERKDEAAPRHRKDSVAEPESKTRRGLGEYQSISSTPWASRTLCVQHPDPPTAQQRGEHHYSCSTSHPRVPDPKPPTQQTPTSISSPQKSRTSDPITPATTEPHVVVVPPTSPAAQGLEQPRPHFNLLGDTIPPDPKIAASALCTLPPEEEDPYDLLLTTLHSVLTHIDPRSALPLALILRRQYRAAGISDPEILAQLDRRPPPRYLQAPETPTEEARSNAAWWRSEMGRAREVYGEALRDAGFVDVEVVYCIDSGMSAMAVAAVARERAEMMVARDQRELIAKVSRCGPGGGWSGRCRPSSSLPL